MMQTLRSFRRFCFLPVFIVVLAQTENLQAQSAPSTNNWLVSHLSSGGLVLRDRGGDLVRWPTSDSISLSKIGKLSADSSLIAGLDPRVGLNTQLGSDPAQLPANQRAQAEPHIARNPIDPDTLAATFQEGRYENDGGAVDCGYSISHDGGLTWSRALIPLLTQTSGGPYYRATDPVAAIDLKSNIFLNTLTFADPGPPFSIYPIVISRSTNGGASFEAPVEVYRPPNSTLQPDKNWMAINTFPTTPTANRIVVTWSMFPQSSGPIPIARSYSDDAGKTWTPFSYVTPSTYSCQGSQPVFLPDGTLAVVYWNFSSSLTVGQAIEVVISTNGGATFGSPKLVTAVTEYDAPVVRQGSTLPSAAGNRTNNALCVVYQARYLGAPRIMFTCSTNKGTTWTTPKPISDNPTNTALFNPAVAVSPDGKTITASFYDQRINPAQNYLFDMFLAQSFDAGNTWQPNLRLTTVSSDVRLAPLTSEGYMLGDYLGIAPPVGTIVPAVPVWVDTRTGNPDPFITRVGIAPQVTFASWRAARFSLAQINNPPIGGPGADPDSDGVVNALEYAFGGNPWSSDKPPFATTFSGSGLGAAFTTTYERLRTASDLSYNWVGSGNLKNWSAVSPSNVVIAPNPTRLTDNVTSTFSPATNAAQFYRLNVTLAE